MLRNTAWGILFSLTGAAIAALIPPSILFIQSSSSSTFGAHYDPVHLFKRPS